jgi:hypothetical protein
MSEFNEVSETLLRFASVIGRPIHDGDSVRLRELGRTWGTEFPVDYLAVVGAYGDASISDYLSLLGAGRLESYAESMGRRLTAVEYVPHVILPSPGGALLWGNTVEGDQLCLVDHGAGMWTVSAFVRVKSMWYDSDLEFAEWLYQALTGQVCTDWLPEWGRLPLAVTPITW